MGRGKGQERVGGVEEVATDRCKGLVPGGVEQMGWRAEGVAEMKLECC